MDSSRKRHAGGPLLGSQLEAEGEKRALDFNPFERDTTPNGDDSEWGEIVESATDPQILKNRQFGELCFGVATIRFGDSDPLSI
ncbi:hypothetical protein TNCV_346711 [Trichonephila clavipes]|nr:hypothetical protein TNCV_346711 [Trichonephila clavipes]